MNEGLNVLSLFDGMSAGMLALGRAGIKVKNYYASEIDKHAIKVSKVNYPNITGDHLAESIHDIINTCFWPYMLYAINRWTSLFDKHS